MDENLNQFEENYCKLLNRLRATHSRGERKCKTLKQETTANEVENLIDYLRLTAVDADNLATIRCLLQQKVDSKRLELERARDSEADVRSRYTSMNNLLVKLKEDINDLKERNELLEQHKSSDTPLMLKLFKTRHGKV